MPQYLEWVHCVDCLRDIRDDPKRENHRCESCAIKHEARIVGHQNRVRQEMRQLGVTKRKRLPRNSDRKTACPLSSLY